MMGEDLIDALTCVSGPETHNYACLRSSRPYFVKKTKYIINCFFFKSKYGGGNPETSMHKRAFQALKRTLMHVSDLPPPYFDFKKLIFFKLVFLSKYGGGRPDTCMRFRPRNARLCMSQVFFHLILIKKTEYFIKCFFNQNRVGEELRHA